MKTAMHAVRRAATTSSTMSYSNCFYHIVMRTYRSIPWIAEAHEKELYAYIHGYCKGVNATLLRIGGMPDHVHILVSIPTSMAVAEFVRRLKNMATLWLKNNKAKFPLFDGWGEGYAAFSYSRFDVGKIKQYIMNQKEHHKRVSFADEYRQWLTENGVTIDEQYFLTDR